MNQTVRLLTLPIDCELTSALVMQLLSSEGLRVVRSFDLRSACASMADGICPHHGSAPCNCQLIVLQVSDRTSSPASLILHGFDEQTDVDLVDSPDLRPDPGFEGRIRGVLDGVGVP